MSSSLLCILNFHGIGKPHEGVSAGEAPYWVSRARFCRILDQIKAYEAQGGHVLITFDDGNRSDFEFACPELVARNLTASFFVLTGRCGDSQYLSAGDIRALHVKGMRIGLHGKDHIDWCTIDDASLATETIEARTELSEIVGQLVDTVAIPFGSYNGRVMRHLKHAGFREIYTSDGGSASNSKRVRHRTSIREDMSDSWIENTLSGKESPVRRLKRGLKGLLKEHVTF